jgi:hypothetical protein
VRPSAAAVAVAEPKNCGGGEPSPGAEVAGVGPICLEVRRARLGDPPLELAERLFEFQVRERVGVVDPPAVSTHEYPTVPWPPRRRVPCCTVSTSALRCNSDAAFPPTLCVHVTPGRVPSVALCEYPEYPQRHSPLRRKRRATTSAGFRTHRLIAASMNESPFGYDLTREMNALQRVRRTATRCAALQQARRHRV